MEEGQNLPPVKSKAKRKNRDSSSSDDEYLEKRIDYLEKLHKKNQEEMCQMREAHEINKFEERILSIEEKHQLEMKKLR